MQRIRKLNKINVLNLKPKLTRKQCYLHQEL